MQYHLNDQVVHPAYGVGRVVRTVTQNLNSSGPQLYYEIMIERSTIWVPVSATTELRPLTTPAEVTHCRSVLREQPGVLQPDHRQRRLELQARLRGGQFQDMCEMVRDLTARGWRRPLSEADSLALRRAREKLSHEWAASTGLAVVEAVHEIEGLLRESRQEHLA